MKAGCGGYCLRVWAHTGVKQKDSGNYRSGACVGIYTLEVVLCRVHSRT